MDEWGWRELETWLNARRELPTGPVFCVLRCQNAGGPLSATDVRRQLRDLGKRAGVTRRVAPHQFRHGFAVEARHEKIDLYALQQQLGHAHLGVTEVYFRSIDPLERLAPIGHRPPPMIVIPSGR